MALFTLLPCSRVVYVCLMRNTQPSSIVCLLSLPGTTLLIYFTSRTYLQTDTMGAQPSIGHLLWLFPFETCVLAHNLLASGGECERKR